MNLQKRSMVLMATNWQFVEFVVHFSQGYLHESEGLAHIYFLYKNESLHHCLSYDSRQMAMFLVLEVRFFQRVRFFSGPGWVQVWLLDDAEIQAMQIISEASICENKL